MPIVYISIYFCLLCIYIYTYIYICIYYIDTCIQISTYLNAHVCIYIYISFKFTSRMIHCFLGYSHTLNPSSCCLGLWRGNVLHEMSCILCGRCLQKRIFCFKNGWVNQVFSVKYPPLLGNGSYLSTLFHARNAGSKQQNMGLLNDVMQTSVILSWSLLSLYFSLMSDCCWRYWYHM